MLVGENSKLCITGDHIMKNRYYKVNCKKNICVQTCKQVMTENLPSNIFLNS